MGKAGEIVRAPMEDANAASYIVTGVVIILIGLGWAIGLSMASTGAGERPMALKLLPWAVAVVGVALSAYGFRRLPKSRPGLRFDPKSKVR